VGEVLEQDVIRLVRRALELLAGQRWPVLAGEGVDLLADDHAEVLQAHLVDALVDGRDELDERDDPAVEDAERFGRDDQGDRPSIPDVLAIGDRVPLEERPEVDVLVPLGDAERQVAQVVRRDVDAARGEAIALQRRERAIVADEVRDRVGRRVTSGDILPAASHRQRRTGRVPGPFSSKVTEKWYFEPYARVLLVALAFTPTPIGHETPVE